MNLASTHDPNRPEISAVILAAGSSRRMGRPKLLLPWGATTVIGQVTAVVCASGVLEPVLVTGRMDGEVRAATAAWGVHWVHNPDYAHTEMLQSLQIGLREISPEALACLVVLGDQPQIEGAVVAQVLRAFRDEPCRILIPSYQQRRGHPWLVHRDLWGELLELPPDANLRIFLNRHVDDIHYLNVSSPSVLMDLDTPEDYARSKPTSDTQQE